MADKIEDIIMLEESNHKQNKTNINTKNNNICNNKIRYFFLTLILFLVGFLIGQYYATSSRSTVYILDEAKFLKLASMGIATSDIDKNTTDLSEADKKKVKDIIIQANKILSEQYNKYPLLIQKSNKNKGYDAYNIAKRIDITVPVLKQLIGEGKWEEIGKVLK